jgi:glycosyltransferase involved in cell wall biosynthesis
VSRNGKTLGGERICAAVVSHLPHDARVWKQARTLAAAGNDVQLIGLRYGLPRASSRRVGSIDVLEIPFGNRRGASLRRRALILLWLWVAVLRTPADTYHCHNIHPAPAVLLAARLRGARIVYDAHELYGEVRPGASIGSRIAARLSRLVERLIVRAADHVITTNPSRGDVIARRYHLDEVTLVANVPAVIESVEPMDPGFPSGPVLLYQGGIYAEARAFEATIQALPLVPDVTLAILGFGRDRDRAMIGEWARDAGVADRVVLYDAVPFDDLVRIAAAATIGIVPLRNISLNSWLGDTNKLFEYLMAGLPVVGSDFPEVRRVVESGSPPVGEVFDPEDHESIAAAVRRVLEEDYDGRRAEARRLALARYCWHHEEPHLLGCYPLRTYGEVLNSGERGLRPRALR